MGYFSISLRTAQNRHSARCRNRLLKSLLNITDWFVCSNELFCLYTFLYRGILQNTEQLTSSEDGTLCVGGKGDGIVFTSFHREKYQNA